MDNKILLDTIKYFNKQHITVIGDIVADIYLHGIIDRISREAPVLVLQQSEEKIVAGGAANVVNNIATIGGKVSAIGILGDDNAAYGLKNILEKNAADTSGLAISPNRSTITKTRIVAGGRATVSQQIVRIDNDNNSPLPNAEEKLLLDKLAAILPQTQGIVLSDYGSGTITPAVRTMVIAYSKQHNIPCMVDSRYSIHDFKGVTYVKQNDAELAAAVNMDIKNTNDLYTAGKLLLTQMKAAGILVTCGEKGMVLFESNGKISSIPVSDKSEVYDVSGAGDTCVAAFITAIATGAEPVHAAKLSNYAAGIAVRKMGTATVSAQELITVLEK
ncbi:bifunctional heptose 7-phosphate kinase/heptose 1-phosphate adenyltransferase [Pectinatus brassicae]|uniref:RfaE bifunctional protein kinase chain/domain n=1 Tax=Pectinatus brassicae TaxID=862415 RepID=A0A840UNZ7_9FIRM|nr:PfkB family carbohydrate kinase [Pectinatus brassicae]MBB5335932.1 rfaE bifunctional protein kinase chain/domain [Pectinatus brassicae]